MGKVKELVSQIVAKLNSKGQEIPDPTPVAVPIGFGIPESLESKIRRMVRSESLSMAAERAGHETFEEADDFDVDDEDDMSSPWEMDFDQEMAPFAADGGGRVAVEERPARPRDALEVPPPGVEPEGGEKPPEEAVKPE